MDQPTTSQQSSSPPTLFSANVTEDGLEKAALSILAMHSDSPENGIDTETFAARELFLTSSVFSRTHRVQLVGLVEKHSSEFR